MANVEKKPDSVQHHEDRQAKMKKESADAAQKQQEEQEIAASGVPYRESESREDILNRIRKMREDAKTGPSPDTGSNTQVFQDRTKLEQEAGRKAVEKAEAEAAANKKIADKVAADAAGKK